MTGREGEIQYLSAFYLPHFCAHKCWAFARFNMLKLDDLNEFSVVIQAQSIFYI
jgi:hypothetical protein